MKNAERSSYAIAVAAKFLSLRGAGFDLSAFDEILIENWRARGLPVAIVLDTLDDIAKRPHRRNRIRHLTYAQDEIEARYAEWLESRVGAH